MLLIRNAQLEALTYAAFVRGLAESHPAVRRALGKRGFRARVDAAVVAAAERGFSGELAERYVRLAVAHGPDELVQAPWAAPILGWACDPALKVAALEAAALREAEQTAVAAEPLVTDGDEA